MWASSIQTHFPFNLAGPQEAPDRQALSKVILYFPDAGGVRAQGGQVPLLQPRLCLQLLSQSLLAPPPAPPAPLTICRAQQDFAHILPNSVP